MDRIVLHIDMNSYFATVEQQANPLLRGRPIIVSGRPTIHSVVAAASIEAKRFGIKSGMSTFEAKRLCPQVIFIPGDPTKYISTTSKLFEIFSSYSPIVEVFSVDEVFVELVYPKNNLETANFIAKEIKKRIKNQVGDYLTCSIGIAKNKFLAKLASEKKKPDGLVVVTNDNLDEILLSSKLDDFCGIGRKVSSKLNSLGIFTVGQLRKTPIQMLVATFGNVRGNQLHRMSFGIDDSPLISEVDRAAAKSYSHNLTLPKETADQKYVWAVILRLCEKVGRRMRRDQVLGKSVYAFVRSSVFAGVGGQKSIGFYTSDGITIFDCIRYQIMKDRLPDSIRSVGVGMGNVRPQNLINATLLPEIKKKEDLVTSMDQVNNRFGENTIFLASTLPCFDRERRVAGIRMRLRFN